MVTTPRTRPTPHVLHHIKMRPSAGRALNIIQRSAIPAKHLEVSKIRPALSTAENRQLARAPTLVERLIERKRLLEAAVRKAGTGDVGDIVVDGANGSVNGPLPWPSNLRVEPVVSRKVFAKIAQEHRKLLKESLKER